MDQDVPVAPGLRKRSSAALSSEDQEGAKRTKTGVPEPKTSHGGSGPSGVSSHLAHPLPTPSTTSVGVASTSRVPAIVGTGTRIYDPLASVIYRLNALEEGVDSFHRETKMRVGELRAMCDELRKGGRF
jgi:hypothetical protein